MHIELHRAVHNAFRCGSIILQIRVMSRNHAKGLPFHQTVKHGFGNSAAGCRLRAAAELVDKRQRAGGGMLHKIFHVQQTGTVSTQIVFDGLFVADVNT